MNVLVVDDDKVDRLTVGELLGAGYDVIEASSEDEARRHLETSSIDCVLLDYLIPGSDSLRLLGELAARPLPVIILTGEGSEHIAVTAMKRGAQDYLSKRNLSGELLSRTIGNAIDNARLKQKLAQKQDALASINAELLKKVAELQRMTHDLRESAEKFRIVADFTYAWEYWRGMNSRFVYNSPSCESLTGYSRDEFGDAPEIFIRIVHPEDRERVVSHVREEETGRGTHELEFRIVRRDGQERWISHVCQTAQDKEGRKLGCRASNRDITDQKRAEAAVEASRQSAEDARRAAEEANRTKDHFLAVLSHELRTPLTPVLAALSLLKGDDSIPKNVQSDLELIQRNVELESRLIDDLLDLNRISRGKVELVKHRLELRRVIERAIEVCRSDLEIKRLQFGFDYGPGPYYVDADEARLEQVFWNVLKNAIKFTPSGGCIGLSCRADAGFVEIKVHDSGIGIEAPHLVTIFDAFSQAESPKSRRFGGLGLGLAIAKALAEMHGGSIGAESGGKDKGSTFTVRLPIVSREALPLPEDAEVKEHPVARPRLRILIVEDNGDTAELISRILRKRGYEVQTAGDVASGLQTATTGRFDLLVSDLGLPDGSGLELLQRLRGRGSEIPAIALSGFGQDSDLLQSKEAGFSSHLVKPVDVDRLLETVAHATLADTPQ